MQRECVCCPEIAVVHETLVRDGVKSEVHLCVAHAQERGYILPSSEGPTLIVSKLLEQTKPVAVRAARACPVCAMTMAAIRAAGLAGCPQCYSFFEGDLGLIIERAQGGATVHVGRHPEHAGELVDRAAMRNKLAKELREAVSREEYERAARLRDALLQLGVPVDKNEVDIAFKIGSQGDEKDGAPS